MWQSTKHWLDKWMVNLHPQSALKVPWRTTEYLVIDLEMTALDIKEGVILSVAWLTIKPPFIELSSSKYYLINQPVTLNQTSAIHGLVSGELAQGKRLDVVLIELLAAMQGKAVIFHHAGLDMAFLRQACQQYGLDLNPLLVLDTMQFEYARFNRLGEIPTGMDLISSCERYDLAEFGQHDALNDVVATGSLFLAQMAHAFGDENVSLNKVNAFFS